MLATAAWQSAGPGAAEGLGRISSSRVRSAKPARDREKKVGGPCSRNRLCKPITTHAGSSCGRAGAWTKTTAASMTAEPRAESASCLCDHFLLPVLSLMFHRSIERDAMHTVDCILHLQTLSLGAMAGDGEVGGGRARAKKTRVILITDIAFSEIYKANQKSFFFPIQ